MFDLAALRARVAEAARVVRVVIAAHEGSSPRETGAAMLIWQGGTEGTIGGGALEWQVTCRARAMLAGGQARQVTRVALGPGIGQCCGGAVTLLAEVYDARAVARLEEAENGVVARPLEGAAEMPLAVQRVLARARSSGLPPVAGLVQGWMVEPMAVPTRDLWIWGAGHVGRALVGVLAPLPTFALTWVDVDESRFPKDMPDRVAPLWAANPADLVAHAPGHAEHLVLSYSHALDLELCHRILRHGHGGLGLIGSATKAARFRNRLRALGHGDTALAGLVCPIGDPTLGKHPQAIAVGVAARLLGRGMDNAARQDGARQDEDGKHASDHRGPDQGLSRGGGE
ncbi:molybdenum cofactor sulfurylase [Defluviimonas sp. 20V17]|uniref:Molybdenum cofactor sulfurylase n=1 Tax=Allgaiera indica TaxID=765699 RepID=A0AAN4UUY8_9RHOB|nr:xanthine dehydrogenase accessory protein XdhC [Allgaiera indica]KDB04898.1 molybdenum cofactor sulfurylase [Defluviimonas sp. 20V17]GHE05606.1 xanthine dehydrogenase accessory protein XdhC [Allgaiera indica]SDX77780.1 molybdenum cofactor sulfurylase [Allgaiera indica]